MYPEVILTSQGIQHFLTFFWTSVSKIWNKGTFQGGGKCEWIGTSNVDMHLWCPKRHEINTTSFLLPVPKLWGILYSHSRINLKADQASCLGDLRSNIMEILLVSYFGMRTTHETHTNVFQYAIRMEKKQKWKGSPYKNSGGTPSSYNSWRYFIFKSSNLTPFS